MPDIPELDNTLTEVHDGEQVTSPAHWATPPTLATEDTLLNIRTAKITSEHLTTLRDAVATDLRRIHVQTNDLSSLTADRFEEIETRIRTLEGTTVSQGSGNSPQALGNGEPQGGSPPGTAYTGNDSRNTLSGAVLPQAVAQTQSQSSFETFRSPRPIQTPSPTLSEPLPQDTPIPPRLSHKRSERFFVSALGIKVPLNISPFSGAPHENFAAFLRTFEDYARASKSELTDKEKLAHFLTLLNDYARDKAEEVREKNEEATFDEIVEHMRTTFQNPARAETEKQLLRQATQRDDENVDQFSTRIRKLAQGAYPDKSRDYIQEKAKEAFVEGLPKNVRFHVKSAAPDTFQKAHDAAIKFEVLLGQAIQGNTIIPQGLVVYPQAPAPAPRNPPQPQQRIPRASGVCFGCGRPGHYIADCRQTQNRLQNQGNGFRGQNRRQTFNNRFPNNGFQGFNNDPRDNAQDFGANFPNNQQRFNSGPRNFGRANQPSFPVANPQDAHQLPSQPQPNRRFVNSFAPLEEDAELQQLRDQVHNQQIQMEAIMRRNNELAAAVIPTTPIRRVNAFSAMPKLGTLLTMFTLICLCNPSLAFAPLMCMPHTPETFLKLPSSLNCSETGRDTLLTKPTPLQLLVLRDNTINYQVNGTMCKIVKRITRFSVNFIGVPWQESTSKQIIVSTEACRNMRQFESCEHGDLVLKNGVYQTTNPHIIQWPSAPLSGFQGVQTVETSNCYMLPITVYGRFGHEAPSSAGGRMSSCKFASGSCVTKEGTAYIWKPITSQQCRYIKMEVMDGYKSGNIWLSANKEFSLSFNNSSPVIFDCNQRLTLTDQGYAVATSSRVKRDVSDQGNVTTFVTSNQLAAQLLANEMAVMERSARWFSHGFRTFCESSNSHAAATLAAVASNPTLAARKLTGKNNIQAKFIGENILAIKSCSTLTPDSFEFVAFDGKCYSKPTLRIRLPNNATVVTFVDLNTRVITNRAHPVECGLVTNFEFIANKSLVSLNPFTLEITTNSDFNPQATPVASKISLDPLEDEPLIFHNLMIGTESGNIQDRHLNEIWEVWQGSEEALEKIISRHSDPASGAPTQSGIVEAVNYWSKAKYIAETAFFVWTLVCNTILTTLVTLVLFVEVVRVYISPWISASRSPPKPDLEHLGISNQTVLDIEALATRSITPAPIPDCTKHLRRIRSPPINVLSLTESRFITAQIPIKVNGISFWALVDTGAGFTVASQDICPYIGISRMAQPTVEHAVGLGGNEVNMEGSATVTFEIGSTVLSHKTHFTTGQCCPEGLYSYEFILGNDILSQLPKFHLDYANNCFVIGDEELPLGTTGNDRTIFPSRYDVHVARDTVIPPRSEAFVKCVVPLSQNELDLVLISQSTTLSSSDLVIAPSVFSTKNPILLITNPTNEPKILYANTTAASATDLNLETESPSVLYYA
ncbi:hypothetical protein CAEBREN_30848 [Caenorhabditis brenneri]|uniref:CCHC-type domain-containing protein n=1 Tax=Caenorhabditis brenneri TaxID=135651 RepID=G0NS50_CAEBE|nr:hypothetical protein CAEBREN_30848 [Caenorhabditis brenneri]